MDAATFFTSPFAIAGLTAIATLTASLGSQAITARANLKTKRLELSYARKVEAYQNYLVALAHYVHSRPDDGPDAESYKTYLKTVMQVQLVSSKEVYDAIMEDDGLLNAVEKIRTIPEDVLQEEYQKGGVGKSFLQVQELMRQDLNRLGGL